MTDDQWRQAALVPRLLRDDAGHFGSETNKIMELQSKSISVRCLSTVLQGRMKLDKWNEDGNIRW